MTTNYFAEAIQRFGENKKGKHIRARNVPTRKEISPNLAGRLNDQMARRKHTPTRTECRLILKVGRIGAYKEGKHFSSIETLANVVPFIVPAQKRSFSARDRQAQREEENSSRTGEPSTGRKQRRAPNEAQNRETKIPKDARRKINSQIEVERKRGEGKRKIKIAQASFGRRAGSGFLFGNYGIDNCHGAALLLPAGRRD